MSSAKQKEQNQNRSAFTEIKEQGFWKWIVQTDEFSWTQCLEPIFGDIRNRHKITIDALLGKIHFSDREVVKNTIFHALKNKQSFNVKVKLSSSNLSGLSVNIHGDVSIDANGTVVSVDGSLANILESQNGNKEKTGHSNSLADLQEKYDFISERFKVIRKDGAIRFFLTQGRVIKNKHGKPVRWHGVDVDITEVVERDQEVQELNEMVSLIESKVKRQIGEEYFKDLVLKLNQAVKANYTYIARIKQDGNTARTIYLCYNNRIEENFEYGLEDTPCYDVASGNICCHPENIQELFPKDYLLADMEIEGYLGVPIHGQKEDQAKYVLVSLFENKIDRPGFYCKLLKIFADQIEVEFDRNRLYHELEEYKSRMDLAIEAAQLGTYEWDVKNNIVHWDNGMFKIMGDPGPNCTNYNDYFFSILHPEDKTHISWKMARLKEPTNVETILNDYYRVILPTGEQKYIMTKGYCQRDNSGQVVRVTAVCLDQTEEKIAEQNLIDSEIKFRTFFNSAPFPIVISNPENNKIEEVNGRFIEKFKYDANEIKNMSITDIDKTNSKDQLRKIYEETRRQGTSNIETLLVDKEGNVIYANVKLSPTEIGGKKLIIGMINDITELQLKKQELAESEAKFRGVFNSFLDMYYESNLDGEFVLLSPSSKDVIGYTEQEMIGKPIESLYKNPHERKLFFKALRKYGKVEGFQTIIINKEGKEVWIESHSELKTDKNGKILGTRGVARDITRRKEQEKTEELYRVALEAMAEGIVIIDSEGNIIGSNDGAYEILCLTKSEFYNRSAFDGIWRVVYPDMSKFPTEEYPAGITLQTGRSLKDVVMGVYRPNNELRWISVNSAPIYFKNKKRRKKPQGVICTFHDITERKRKDEQIKTIINTVPHMIFAKDIEGNYLFANNAVAEAYGLEIDQIKHSNYADLQKNIPVEQIMSPIKINREVIKTKKPKFIPEEKFYDKDGRLRRLQIHKIPFNYDNQECVLGVAVDITDIKNLEYEIKKSEEKYRQLTQSSPIGVVIHSKGIIRYVNDTGVELFRANSTKDLIGLPIIKFIIPKYVSIVKERLNRLESGKDKMVSANEVQMIMFDGEVRDIIIMGTSIEYEGEMAIQAVFYDTTEKKKTERKVIERENQLSTVLNTMSEGLILVDSSGGILEQNRASEKILGIKGHPLTKRHIFDGKFKLVRENGTEYIASDFPVFRALKNREPVNREIIGVVRSKKEITWINMSVQPIELPNSEDLFGAVVTFADVTESRKSRNQLKQLALVAERTDNAVVITDKKDRVEWVNKGFERISGYSQSELLGKNLDRVVYGPQTDPKTKRFIRNKVRKGESFETEILNYKKNGNEFWVKIDGQPILDDEGKVKNYISVQSDVTDRIKSDKRKNLVNEINGFLILGEKTKDNIESILKLLCSYIHADYAEYWHINEERKLECFANFIAKNDFRSLAKDSQKRLFQKNSYPLGYFFENREPNILLDVSNIEDMPQGEIFANLNINSLFGLPIITGKDTLGIILLYNPGYLSLDAEEKEIFKSIGHQFGQFVARYNANQKLLNSLEEKDFLFKEVHHRVKNNLQLIVSTLYLKLYNIQDIQFKEKIEDIISGVKSIAIIHEQLMLSKNVNMIEISQYIERLINEIPVSLGFNNDKLKITADVDTKIVKMDFAVNLGLLINELIANSMKHAFTDGQMGIIKVSFKKLARNLFKLTFADNGIGIPDEFKTLESDHSLGLNMINSFAMQLKAEVEVDNNSGTRFSFTFHMNKQ